METSSYFVSVSGADTNPGTQAGPFRTLEHALTQARLTSTKRQIVLEEGQHVASRLSIDGGLSGLVIEGAAVSATTWRRLCGAARATATTVTVASTTALALRDGAFTLRALQLVGADAGVGAVSTYGVFGENVALTLEDVVVRAGRGGQPVQPPRPAQVTGQTACNTSTPGSGANGAAGGAAPPAVIGRFSAAGYLAPAASLGAVGGAGATGTAATPRVETCRRCDCGNCMPGNGSVTEPVGDPGCGGLGGMGGPPGPNGGASVAVFLSGASSVVLRNALLVSSTGGDGAAGAPGGLGAAGAAGTMGPLWCPMTVTCAGTGGRNCGTCGIDTESGHRFTGSAGGNGGPGGPGGPGGAGSGGWSVGLVAPSDAGLFGLDGGASVLVGQPGDGGVSGSARAVLVY